MSEPNQNQSELKNLNQEISSAHVYEFVQKARKCDFSDRRLLFRGLCAASMLGAFFQPFGATVGFFYFLFWGIIWKCGDMVLDFFAVYFYDRTLKHILLNPAKNDKIIEPDSKYANLSFSDWFKSRKKLLKILSIANCNNFSSSDLTKKWLKYFRLAN